MFIGEKRKMIEWLVIGVLIVIALAFAKMRHVKHRTFAIFVVILLVFLYLSVSSVMKESTANLKSFTGWVSVGKTYFSWLANAGVNVKNVVGHAIKMDWAGNLTGK